MVCRKPRHPDQRPCNPIVRKCPSTLKPASIQLFLNLPTKATRKRFSPVSLIPTEISAIRNNACGFPGTAIMPLDDYSPYQQRIIKRYYENQDTIQLQRL